MPNEERAPVRRPPNAIGDEYANMAANAELSRGRAHDGAAYNMSQGFGRYQPDMPRRPRRRPLQRHRRATTLVEEPDRASVYVDDDGDEWIRSSKRPTTRRPSTTTRTGQPVLLRLAGTGTTRTSPRE